MGKIIKISTDKIKPSQDYLKEGTVKFILNSIFENKREDLPPEPMVRIDPDTSENYIAIDGHNLIAVKDLLGEEIEVYVADSEDDFIEGEREAIEKRNEELKEKFNSSLGESERVERIGISDFGRLREKYSYLENVELARKEIGK